MRAIALAASVSLVVIHWDRESAWFWVGVVLVVLNVLGILGAWSRGAGARDVRSAHGSGSAQSCRLDEWLPLPGVVTALAGGPQRWRQVSYRGDDHIEPARAWDLAHFVWLEHDGEGWEIGLGEEVKPYLDLDIDEADDPIIAVLVAHPSVEDAFHEDREVYVVTLREPLDTPDFAVLVAQALVAHHVHAASQA